MAQTAKELVASVIESLRALDATDPAADDLAAYTYTPSSALAPLQARVEKLSAIARPKPAQLQELGRTLEQLACVAFCSLTGWDTVQSYQAAGPQIDLLISGASAHWEAVSKVCLLRGSKPGILIEAKATNAPASDAVFSRLCSIAHHNFNDTVGLAVLFSLNGATGFPTSPKQIPSKLGQARLRQVLLRAKHGIPVVVLDHADLKSLGRSGSLPRLLRRKVLDIDSWTATDLEPLDAPVVELPAHLRSHVPGTT